MPFVFDENGEMRWVDIAPPGQGIDPTNTSPDSPAPGTIPGGGGGFSYSYQGTNPTKAALAQRGYEGDLARAEAQAKQEFEGAAIGYADVAKKRANSIISAEDAQNAPSQYRAQQAQIFATARANQDMAKLNRQFLAEEQHAVAASQLVEQKALADYRTQVQQYQAMHVNPGQLWHDMGSTGQAMSVLAVAVHDFLGAKGIKTSTMDTLNRAIDNSINAQIQNIQKQGQVAEHFGQLYQFAVSQSASEAEVRTRLRGFYLAAAEKEILSQLAQYDAPLAQAKAAEARALIADQFQRDITQLQQMTAQRLDAVRGDLLQKRGQDMQAAAETRRLQWEKDKALLELAAKQGAGGSVASEENVYMDVEGKLPQGVILPGVSEGEVANIRAMGAGAAYTMRGLKKLRDMVNKHGKQYGGNLASQLLTSEDQKRIASLQTEIAFSLAQVLNGGGRLTKEDVEEARKLVPIETLTTWGEVENVINDTITRTKDLYNLRTAGKVREFRPGERVPDIKGLTPNEGNAIDQEAKDQLEGVQPVRTDIDEHFAAAQHPDESNPAYEIDQALRLARESGDPEIMKKAVATAKAIAGSSLDASNKFNADEAIAETLRATGGSIDSVIESGALQVAPDSWTPEQMAAFEGYLQSLPSTGQGPDLSQADPAIREYIQKVSSGQ